MTDLLDLCREYSDKCLSRAIVADTEYLGVRRVFGLLTDGKVLYGLTGGKNTESYLSSGFGSEFAVNLTDRWVYDTELGKCVYGTEPKHDIPAYAHR
jgi:hypothetical protein